MPPEYPTAVELYFADGSFACYCTPLESADGERTAAVPAWCAPGLRTSRGATLGPALKRAMGLGIHAWAEGPEPPPAFALDFEPLRLDPRVCDVGPGLQTVGFAHWVVGAYGIATMRFAQYGDPRLTGAPVLEHATGALLGVYATRSWTDDTRAEAVPRDLLGRRARAGWDAGRGDVGAHAAAGWGAAGEPERPQRAVEVTRTDKDGMVLEDWVFHEAFAGRAAWAAHVFPGRRFVREDECRTLRDPFAFVARALGAGAKEVAWADGSALRVPEGARVTALGFAFERAAVETPVETPNKKKEWPCVNWE